MWPSPRAGPKWELGRATLPPLWGPSDADEGNRLWLRPQQPEGWRPAWQPLHTRQPFALAAGEPC